MGLIGGSSLVKNLVFVWLLAVEPGFKGRPWSSYRG